VDAVRSETADLAGAAGDAASEVVVRGVALLCLVAGVTTTPSGAATIDLSLQEAVARALSDGTAARIAVERVAAAEASAAIGRSALLPTLESSLSGSDQIVNLKTFGFTPPDTSPLIGPFSVVDGRVAAATKLVDVSALRRYQAALRGVAVSESERRATENDVAAAVATLYVAMQRSQAKLEQARANVELFSKLADLARDQEKAGTAVRLATMRADVQLLRERQAELVARNDLDAARLALLHAIGADLGEEVRLTDPLAETDVAFRGVDEALEAARAERPELAASAERARAAELRLAAARAERWPVIGARAFAGENGNGPSDLDATYTAEGLLTVPLFTGGRIDGEISAARAERHQRDLETIELERQVAEEVRRALLAHESAKSRVRLAVDNARLAAAEFDVARDRFAAGLSASIDVDTAQTSLSAAESARIDALADEAQAAIDLQKATGRIRDLVPGGTP
jgi:outer membrane protein